MYIHIYMYIYMCIPGTLEDEVLVFCSNYQNMCWSITIKAWCGSIPVEHMKTVRGLPVS